MRLLFVLFLISFLSLSADCQEKNHFSETNAIKLIELLQIDSSPEMSTYIIVEQKLNSETFLLAVVQSKLEIELINFYSFNRKGQQVYVADYSNTKTVKASKIHGLFFETDAPFWKVFALFPNKKSPQFFTLNKLGDSRDFSDSTDRWDIGN